MTRQKFAERAAFYIGATTVGTGGDWSLIFRLGDQQLNKCIGGDPLPHPSPSPASGRARGRPGVRTQTLVSLNFSAVVAPMRSKSLTSTMVHDDT